MTENQRIECERPDKQRMEYSSGYSGSGSGYNQACGGWEHTETGVIYAIANWGNARFWRVTDTSHIDGSVYPPVVKEETNVRHGYHAQMMWWFNEKDIDVTKLVPINFRWHDAPVGSSYTLEDGPMKGKSVSESLPAEIPRAMMHAIHEKMYLDADGKKHETPVAVTWWENADVVTISMEESSHMEHDLPTETSMLAILGSVDEYPINKTEEVVEESPTYNPVSPDVLGGGMN